jgi:NTE family protein
MIPDTIAVRLDNSKKADLVFEGGGVKGIALVGALSVLEEQGYHPQNLAGTSAGAIVATLYAAGYTAAELRDIIGKLDFARFLDQTWLDRIPILGAPMSVLKDAGLFEGNYFLNLMTDLLGAKGVHTFRDLIHPEFLQQDPEFRELRYKYKVQIIVSDLTERCLLVLPRDAQKLGIDPDDLNVALAVRMSMSIPIFFEPVWFRNPKTAQEQLLVDGGLLTDIPVWLLDSPGPPPWPTFGLRLVDPDPKADLGDRLPEWQVLRHGGITATVQYLKALVGTVTGFFDRLYIEKEMFARTIPISNLGISSINFGLTPQQVTDLYQSGRDAATEFLAHWSFEGYVAAFRSGKPHDRGEEVAAEMRQAPQEVATH